MRTDIVSPLKETAAGAVAEEVLRACVHCGLCNAACPTYALTGDELDGPRGRIYLMKGALEGEACGPLTQHHLDRCLECRACESACPSGVEYHRLLDIGRAHVSARVRRPGRERWLRAAVRWVASRPAVLGPLLTLARALRPVLPLPLAKAARDRPTAGAWPLSRHARRMLILGGCVQKAAAGHFNAATARVFDAAGVSLTETPGCCGALPFHLDAPVAARDRARMLIGAWTAAIDGGAEAIVVNASGCAAFIRDWPDLFGDEPDWAARARHVLAHLRDPLEVLTKDPPAAKRKPAAARVAVHDPCTLRNGPRLVGAAAQLLASLGYDPQPVADPHMCCGSAGAYFLLQEQMAHRLREARLAALAANAPQAIYTANIGCWLQLAGEIPVRHWIEAVDDVVS
jgi:glycolate oxidase iron-sulfur subunit